MILHKEDFDAIRDLIKEEIKKALEKEVKVAKPEPTKEKK